MYSPKFYPFASPYKSQWIPGIVIKDKVHGEKRIYFKSPERLSDFIEQYHSSIGNDKVLDIFSESFYIGKKKFED